MATLLFGDEIDHVQGQISRADTKASILTGLSLAALTGGAALAGKAHLHGFAVAGAVLTAALIGAALVLLGWAIRPDLRGNHGFVRWAATPDAKALKYQLEISNRGSVADEQLDCARQLWSLARTAQAKYARIRRAVDLLGAALGFAALTAILTGLGW
ncbi:Pycsar system effector family protein [Paractinoplanes lichenicola]|uniref:Pycsar effector protein domain-containing protein n=1 Tax=Paractinoplanes lichenicola TaxID=2802976 RepID=A0ABS1VXF0_9ACTN|nr:Pycsar system effector family protein [Actinoplanes lichenicola]MBL7259166.1 hypothetical protein [Actinoplanes lichenicola]